MIDTQTLHTLYELHTRSVNAGGEGLFPEDIYWSESDDMWAYRGSHADECIHDEYALDIANAHAERWLRELSWASHINPRNTDVWYCVSEKSSPDFTTLTDAIRYEVERMEQEIR